MQRKLGIAAIAAGTALALGACASPNTAPAEEEPDYPTKPITVVIPYPAGSAPDTGGRTIAQALEDELGTSFVIENIEGGASTIGMLDFSSREPDGYSIAVGSFSGISLQSRRIDNPFEGLTSLTPIAQTKAVAFFLFAAPDRGWDTIEAFIADAKANPGGLTIGVPNEGSTPDLLVGLLEESAGIELERVYFDAGQQVLPTVNGTTDLGIAQASPVIQFVESGQLAFVGLFGAQDVEGLDVPKFDDAGYNTSEFADFEGIFGPAGMPESIVQILSDAIGVAVESQSYQELMASSYATPLYLPADEFREVAESQDEFAASLFGG